MESAVLGWATADAGAGAYPSVSQFARRNTAPDDFQAAVLDF
ncbi:hypothetical protein [Candidatus Rhodoblastus alkanivorans]|nr:hypothetical protein [Candidatus Rhodoblastus alkanivorans]